MSDTVRAGTFVDSLGVNVHLEYTDGRYANVAQVIADLSYLGISYVRDGAVWSANQGQASYNKLADAGFQFDMLVQGGRDPIAAAAAIATWSDAHPGSVIAIEGPNEINNWPVKYAGLTGKSAGIAFQEALNTAVRHIDGLDDVDLYGLTGTNATTSSDYANFHAYPKNGAEPWNTLVNGLQTQTTAMAGKPVVLTETGYYTAPQSSNWGGVDQRTQAKMTLNTLMDATALGVSKTYLYQLLDPYADATGLSIDKNLGLFDIAGNAKLAATAIHNLTTLLADDAPDAMTFATDPIDFTIKNLPVTGNILQFEKSSGEHDIVVWAEPDIWDEINHVAIAAPSRQVTLDFGTDHYSIAIFDPLSSSTHAARVYQDATAVKFYVSDHPIIVELTAIGPGTAMTLGDTAIVQSNTT